MEREFDESFVIDKYLNLLRSLALSAAHRTESPPR